MNLSDDSGLRGVTLDDKKSPGSRAPKLGSRRWLSRFSFRTLFQTHRNRRAGRPGLGALLVIAVSLAVVPTVAAARPSRGASAAAKGAIGQPGEVAVYRYAGAAALRPSVVASFTLALGPVENTSAGKAQWIRLSAAKQNGERFRVFLLSAGYPPASLQAARKAVRRYLLQEGSSEAREYRNAATEAAVLPAIGGWKYLLPRPAGTPGAETGPFAKQVNYLGHRYVRQSLGEGSPALPPTDAKIVLLRPDVLIGQEGNRRQKNETRRYDGSDYQYVKLSRRDYQTMAQAGINCVQVDAEQAPWAKALGLFYWGGGAAVVKFPESLYDSQYLGPTMFLDEPGVGTRDYVLRPRLRKDPAFRRSITPQAALAAFRKHYAKAMKGAPYALMSILKARPDVDLGDMYFAQQNLFSWETMIANSAYELSQNARVPAAFVFEPPGRIGTRRTLPEMDMTYGVQIRPDDPLDFTSILFGFLRGAARATHKSWGISIYGQVQQEDSPFWLTHAYDMGATRFFFWDSAALAAVPFHEVLALSRFLRTYADMHPRQNLSVLNRSAKVAILLPPGYNLGHVYMGRGILWGLPELNLERTNRDGVKYRTVMGNFFTEIERCLKLGESFDLLWNLPGLNLEGYREIVRIREDGKVEVTSDGKSRLLDGPRVPPRLPGSPPELKVKLVEKATGSGIQVSALARVVETSAPVYYTYGAAPDGIVYNEMVDWELFGPNPQDYEFIRPKNWGKAVTPTPDGGKVRVKFKLTRPGAYRLRAATVDTEGRSTVVWKHIVVPQAPKGP